MATQPSAILRSAAVPFASAVPLGREMRISGLASGFDLWAALIELERYSWIVATTRIIFFSAEAFGIGPRPSYRF